MSQEFIDAALAEQEELDVDLIMAELLEQTEEEGKLQVRPDDMKLRDYLFVIDRLNRETEQLKENKKQVVLRWDNMIAKKQDNIDTLKGVVLQELLARKQEDPKKGKLVLDIGTLSTTTKKPKIVAEDEMALQMRAIEHNDFKKFMVPAKLNKTALLKALNDEYKDTKEIPDKYADIVKLSEESTSLLITSRMK